MKTRNSNTLTASGMVLMAWVLLSPCSWAQLEKHSDEAIDKLMEEKTKTTYELARQSNQLQSRMGKKRNESGWPKSLREHKLRFIRIDHGGMGWNDGMDKSNADENFLKEFAKVTGFQTAAKGESISIAQLDKYSANDRPAFVYLTGNAAIGKISKEHIEILRDYCIKGGMLIADAGSVTFHDSFLHLMRQTFPEKKPVDIASDDDLFQVPYAFSDGAPAFWHHGGRRALGIKYEGRWCVFYHPGDFNDAWKSDGYADVTPEMRQSAMNLGVNLVYNAHRQMDEFINKDAAAQKQNIVPRSPDGEEVNQRLGKP